MKRTNPAALGALILALLSCGEGVTPPPPPPPPPPDAPQPATVTLAPDPAVVVAGETIQLTARVLDSRARVISDAPVTWTSSDPAVASVDGSGLVTGLREGHANVTATSGPATASVPATVHSRDRATLMDLRNTAGGGSWTREDNWGSDAPVGDWYGVGANADARVLALRLSDNGLRGALPANLGDLALLTELRVDGNALSGPIPFSLSALPLRELQYGGTMLCTLRDEGFRAWLSAVPSRGGEDLACNEERADLVTLYEAMGGSGWQDATNWLTESPVETWFGVEVDSTGRVTGINLNRNNLSGEVPPEIGRFPHLRLLRLDYNRLEGAIPPEIGHLTELRRTDLDGNDFKGEIPPEIGNLRELEVLWLAENPLSGPIPPGMGNLVSLRQLELYNTRVEGSIPAEFGGLTEIRTLNLSGNRIESPLPPSLAELENLEVLNLGNNKLAGPLPAALGQLDALLVLALEDNQFSGAVPPEFGDMTALRGLYLQNNPELSGPLPESLTSLGLVELITGGTSLCVPDEPAFDTWLESVFKWRIRPCGAEAYAEAYLTQATQSREFPVPLVAGESALLRVFVMSEQEITEMIPPVRATFFVDGVESHVTDIPAGSSPVPTEVRVGELDLSANAEIPADVIQPGLEMVVEIDPDGTLDPALGVAKRIPAEGRAVVDVGVVPGFHLTLIPFVSTADNDRGAVTLVGSANPGDDIFWQTNNLLPVGAFEITRHASVTVDSNDIFEILDDVGRIRTVEEGRGHWMGLLPDPSGAAGVAYLQGKTSVSLLSESTIAHELGHNLSLRHADCGDPAGADPTFPWPNGRTGVWGYDPRDGGSLVPPDWADLMSYCNPEWVSDYYFTNALRFRLADPDEVRESRVPAAATKTLLVSGGVAADGTPRLDPAFVVDAPPALPRSAGPYALTGRRADGSELFSLSFDVPELWDGDGRSGFTFALPVQPAWESELASLSVSGPGGSVQMREGSEPAMAILRDPRTGQVRAILRDLPAGPLARGAADARAPEPGLEVMLSSGLPGAAAWRR